VKGTFTLPEGHKVRVASARRYVVVSNRWQDDKFRVEARSDSRDTILARWRSLQRQANAAGSYTYHVIDTVEGEVIR